MWKIRFFLYPRNSVENLNRALYIKLLKTQWLSDRKLIPFPAGKGIWKFPEITRNETKIQKETFYTFYFLFFFAFHLFVFQFTLCILIF